MEASRNGSSLEFDHLALQGPGEGHAPAIAYPEGGFAAWTVAFGAWCSMTAGLGLVNSVGIFQSYFATNLLPGYSADAIGWLCGIYVFVSYFCGVFIGPIFDARGPRQLMLLGSIGTLVGIFVMSICKS